MARRKSKTMSKPKTKRQHATVATAESKRHSYQRLVSGHLRELHDFVNNIIYYAEEPSNWPLTQQEQIAFVRTVIFQARKLRKSEWYVTTDSTRDDNAPERCAPAAGSAAVDAVNHPPHYTQHPSGVECIQVTECMNFCLGNAVKYIWRADLKNDAIEDLEKARWYVSREIERRRRQSL